MVVNGQPYPDSHGCGQLHRLRRGHQQQAVVAMNRPAAGSSSGTLSTPDQHRRGEDDLEGPDRYRRRHGHWSVKMFMDLM